MSNRQCDYYDLPTSGGSTSVDQALTSCRTATAVLIHLYCWIIIVIISFLVNSYNCRAVKFMVFTGRNICVGTAGKCLAVVRLSTAF